MPYGGFRRVPSRSAARFAARSCGPVSRMGPGGSAGGSVPRSTGCVWS